MSENSIWICPRCQNEIEPDTENTVDKETPTCSECNTAMVHQNENDEDEDEVNIEQLSGSELVDHFLDEKGLYCYNVESLNQLTSAIGYKEQCYRNGSSIEEFLNDNSACCDKIVEWISQYIEECDEWKESLRNSLDA